MATTIIGTLPMTHAIDPSGSMTINVPILLPSSRFNPVLSFAYHSSATGPSKLGFGWVLKGAPIIERVPPTFDQDGIRRAVKYNSDDRFALDGQRLMKIKDADSDDEDPKTEYRFEIEQWSKIFAYGDQSNPSYWEQHLPDGTIRYFGNTTDSNITGFGITSTRVWAISKFLDAFNNAISYTYIDESDTTGDFYLRQISYGGNKTLGLDHQRLISFTYEPSSNICTRYFAGSKIVTDMRLWTITSYVNESLVHTHTITYDLSPLTKVDRIDSIILGNSSCEVNPLYFDWYNGDPVVFDPTKDIAEISYTGDSTTTQIIPLDSNANGTTDLVIASSQKPTDDDAGKLYIDVYLSDGEGGISSTPTSESGSTDLDYSQTVLPMDTNGDGMTDLVHILLNGDNSTYSITVLLSDGIGGYVKQDTIEFTPEDVTGYFYSGDFEGTGHAGLLYLYRIEPSQDTSQLKFIQFISDDDGKTFKGLSAKFGPSGGKGQLLLTSIEVVVGDLDGDGADDVFLVCPDASSPPNWAVYYLESQSGTLNYQGEPFSASVETITYVSGSRVLPFSADGDAKSSLLFLSQTWNNTLQYQLLRSTGKGFIADENPQDLGVTFGGVSIVKISSANVANLVSVVNGDSGPTLYLFRFTGVVFEKIDPITQPDGVPKDSVVRWADLRGIGRSDCVLNTLDDDTNIITVRSLQLIGYQPLDRVGVAQNGFNTHTEVVYAPLSNPAVYTAAILDNEEATALMNSLAGNCSSAATLVGSSQKMECTRTEFISFPMFVVKSLSTFPWPDAPVSDAEVLTFEYRNGLISFQGRGWLGFESITKTFASVGIVEVTKFYQQFPLIGQVSSLEKTDNKSPKNTWQVNSYVWNYKTINNGKNYVIYLSSLEELYYERLGAVSDVTGAANEVDVVFQYDEYGNISSFSISSRNESQLTIESTYENPDTTGWVVGNKAEEKITRDNVLLSHIQQEYLSGTTACTLRRKMIDDSSSTWFTTQFTYDGAGNNTEVKRKGSYRQTYTYDSTYSYICTITSYTSESAFFVESRTYDLAISSPITIEKPNGIITKFEYDILGRVVTISQGRSLDNLKVLEEISFSMDSTQVMEMHKIWNGLDGPDNDKRIVITYFDGLKRITSVCRSRPDDLSKFIVNYTRYDAAGRISSRSKDFLPGQTPNVTFYSYDPMSRLTQEVYFPEGQSGPSVSRTIDYTFESQTLKISETLVDSETSEKQQVFRVMVSPPNADNPQAGNFIKLCVSKRTNELGQITTTSFDRLARPEKITDPAGVNLNLSYDMLSRQIGQSLVNKNGVTFSHSSLKIDNEESQSTLKNEITGTKVVTQTDYCGRLTSKVTRDETLTFTYDADQFSNEQLSSVTSSKNINYDFTYDDHGYLQKSTITLDSRSFSTSYSWTETGQLLTIINPNGDIVNREYYPDGLSPKTNNLSADSSSKASLEFSSLNNQFGQPLTRTFGNGIISTSTSSSSGMLTSNTLTKDNSTLLKQLWALDSYNKIINYTYTKDTTWSSIYEYDLSGELTKYSVGNTETPLTYDASGNIASKSGYNFTNDGWQVISACDSGGTTSIVYSDDGKMTKKERGNSKIEMTYDTEGRLIQVDDTEDSVKETTTFLYDFEGRLLQTTLPNGNIVIYVSQVYEVEIIDSTTPETQSRTSYLFQKYRSAAYETQYTEGSTTAAGTVYYFHNNNIGSTIAVSDVNGAIITQYTYDASGKIVKVDGDDVARYTYSGKELIGALYYFGARFYDPDVGRFLTLDTFPVDLNNITPSCFNLYLFSRNDPVNFIDVNGNAPVPAWHWWVDGLLIGAGVAVLIICSPAAGAGILAFVAVAAVGGALIGGGFSGLVTDVQVQADPKMENNDVAWGMQIGLGMFFGGVGGAVGGAAGGWVGSRFPTLTLVNWTQGKSKALPLLGKFTFLTTVDAVVGGAGGALQQYTTNLTDPQIIDKGEGVLQSCVIGFAGGAFFSAGVNGLSEAHTLGPAVTKAYQGVSKSIQQRSAAFLRSFRADLPPPQVSLAQGDKAISWYKKAYGRGPEFIDIPFIDDTGYVETQL